MTLLDVAFSLVSATAAVLTVLSDFAEKTAAPGRERKIDSVRRNARWINLLFLAMVFLVGGTTMTGNFALNGALAFLVPLAIAVAVEHLILRRRARA